MNTPYRQRATYTREFIDHAVSMATGGVGRDGVPSLRPVARELGLSPSTLRNWVYRAARESRPGRGNPPREEPHHDDPCRPDPRAMGPTPALGDRRRGPTDRLAHLICEYERLKRENAALKATLVLLARDLDNRA